MVVVIDNITYAMMNCGKCGIVFFVPKSFYDQRINNGDDWHCPNGHKRIFTEPEVNKLERRLDEKEKEIEKLKTNQITLKIGFDNREKELVRLRKRVKKLKAGA